MYQAGSWDRPRRVVAKVEWHQGELFPRVGFIVTNMSAKPEGVVHFYNGRGTAEQWIKEGKYALHWTRLSCKRFVCNQVRLGLFVLAYNLGNFLRRLVLPRKIKHWSLRSLLVKLIEIGAKVVRHNRYTTFQMAAVAIDQTETHFMCTLERLTEHDQGFRTDTGRAILPVHALTGQRGRIRHDRWLSPRHQCQGAEGHSAQAGFAHAQPILIDAGRCI